VTSQTQTDSQGRAVRTTQLTYDHFHRLQRKDTLLGGPTSRVYLSTQENVYADDADKTIAQVSATYDKPQLTVGYGYGVNDSAGSAGLGLINPLIFS
jgi:YD repeat-containing protein